MIETSEYPPAPWSSKVKIWMSTVKLSKELSLPDDLKYLPFLKKRLFIFLIKYYEGTLVYDEFAISSMVRYKRTIGNWVHKIWVNDEASMKGGREVWGLPKEIADFKWEENKVKISNNTEDIATFDLRTRPEVTYTKKPRLHFKLSGFGIRKNELVFAIGRSNIRLRKKSIKIAEWNNDILPDFEKEKWLGFDFNPGYLVAEIPRVIKNIDQPI